MINWIVTKLSLVKCLSPDQMCNWKGREVIELFCLLGSRVFRGFWVKLRLGRSDGVILCDQRVRLYHARHIQTGRSFSMEEGCEIVGLSKKGVVFGNRCTVGRFATIRPSNVLFDEAGEGMKVGDCSNIGAYSYIGCSGYIEIGNNVMMGPRVNLMAENHNFSHVDTPMKEQGVTRSFIRIEDDVWLGVNSTVVAGVTIGRGSIVAAGAVVTKDVAPYSIVAGVPARVIQIRKKEDLI